MNESDLTNIERAYEARFGRTFPKTFYQGLSPTVQLTVRLFLKTAPKGMTEDDFWEKLNVNHQG